MNFERVKESMFEIKETLDQKDFLRYTLLTVTLSGIVGIVGNIVLRNSNEQSITYVNQNQTAEPTPTELPKVVETRTVTAQIRFERERNSRVGGLLDH